MPDAGEHVGGACALILETLEELFDLCWGGHEGYREEAGGARDLADASRDERESATGRATVGACVEGYEGEQLNCEFVHGENEDGRILT